MPTNHIAIEKKRGQKVLIKILINKFFDKHMGKTYIEFLKIRGSNYLFFSLQAKSGVEVESTEIALAFPLSDKFLHSKVNLK